MKHTIKQLIPIKDLVGQTLTVKSGDSYSYNQGNVLITKSVAPRKIIKPGNYKLSGDRYDGVSPKPIEFKNKKLQRDLSGTKFVEKEIETFLKNFHLYQKRGITPKRALLLYSQPGQGKTSAITSAVERFTDKNTLILNWLCGSPDEQEVLDWFSTRIRYHSKVDKLILIIEDLGGTWDQQFLNTSALLNLLDGSYNIFKVPTMIIATTNYPEKLLESIANRPGRFDSVKEMPNLTAEDRYNLSKFYAHDLLKIDESVVKREKYKKLTISHIEEAVNKAILESLSIEQSLDLMLEFDLNYKKNFSKKQKMGLKDD